MAGKVGVAQIAGVSTGTAAKTLLQLVAAANHPIKIAELSVGFKGTSNSASPVTVKLIRQSDAGTTSALTINDNNDSDGDTFDTTGRHTATAEPTGTTVVRVYTLHQQTSMAISFPEDTRPHVGAGDRLGLVVTSADDINCDASMVFVE